MTNGLNASTVITLQPGERVVAVVPEFCGGPGWANAVAWVHIASATGQLRTECIQPDERTPELDALFAIGAQIAKDLSRAVPVQVRGKWQVR